MSIINKLKAVADIIAPPVGYKTLFIRSDTGVPALMDSDGNVANLSLGGDASGVTYTPLDVLDWTDSVDPGNVAEALDDLALRTHALENSDATPPDASGVTYEPQTPLHWTDSEDPGNVDAALDDLAARVHAIEENPGGSGVTDAADLTYTPLNNADWNGGTDPGDAADALDQLAERVTSIEGLGGAGTVTSVDASGGVQTASGSAITATGTIRGAHVINAQTGTSYALLAADRGKHVTLSNASSIAVTIAQAGTTGFEDGWFSLVENIGVGAVTITPTTSTINGAATLVLTGGMSAILFSDGTNYRAMVLDPAGVVVNAQTGTTYTYLSGDRGKLVTHSNAAAIAGTLPQATGAFGSGWFMWVENRGAGTLTITPTTSTIDGAASLALTTNQGCLVASDGTNYYTMRGIGGSGGSLTNWTESVNSSAPNATIPAVRFIATNAASSVDAVVSPKGPSGSLMAHSPDSSTTGGNKRGSIAVDWQLSRNNAAHVASGTSSTISGGRNNTASSAYATVGGGTTNTASTGDAATVAGGESNTASNTRATVGGGASNTASGVSSTVVGGFQNTANGDYSVAMGRSATARGTYGANAFSGGALGSGNDQRREFILYAGTTDATPKAMSTDAATAAASNTIVLPNNSLFAFRGQLVVFQTATTDSKAIEFKGAIKRGANAAATALLGSVTQADLGTPDAGASTWTVAFTANTTLGGLAVTVTGEASHTLRWVAEVITTEVVG